MLGAQPWPQLPAANHTKACAVAAQAAPPRHQPSQPALPLLPPSLQVYDKKSGKGCPLGLGYALKCFLFSLVCLAAYCAALPVFNVENLMGQYSHWNVLARWVLRAAGLRWHVHAVLLWGRRELA